jgi:quercetin dioxygenase-like cupin family protein
MGIMLSKVEKKEIIPGYFGRFIHTQNMSVVFWEATKGAIVPEHYHMNEQIMQVLEGKFEFTLDNVTAIYEPGTLVIIPPNVPHSGKALTACKLMDIFSPVRSEYK